MKKILVILLIFSYIILGNTYGKDNGPNLNDVIDAQKYRNFFFGLEIKDKQIKSLCKNYLYQIDNINKSNKYNTMFFILRGDIAKNKTTHKFYFSCPVIVEGDFYYNLYNNGDTKLFIDVCGKDISAYKQYNLGKNLFGLNKEICFYYPSSAKIGKIKTINQKTEDKKKILENRLGFNSIFQPIMISLILMMLILSGLIWKKSF